MGENNEYLVVRIFKGIFSFLGMLLSLDVGCLIALVVAGLVVMGWISSWPVFADRETVTQSPFVLNTKVYVQYQKGGEFLIQEYKTDIVKTTHNYSNWLGQVNKTPQCVMIVTGQPWSKTDAIVDAAEKILTDNGLPLDFESHREVGINGFGVDCDKNSMDLRINIRLSGEFGRDGDYLFVFNPTNLAYEESWIILPVDLYDQVLKSAVDNTGFSFGTFSSAAPGNLVAQYVAKDGDPNGLKGWVDSYQWLLQKLYGTTPTYSFTEKTVDLTSYETVSLGSGKWKCEYRVKGNCRDRTWVSDTTKISNTSQQKVIEGNYMIVQ